jgi:hypothetical protein
MNQHVKSIEVKLEKKKPTSLLTKVKICAILNSNKRFSFIKVLNFQLAYASVRPTYIRHTYAEAHESYT